MSAPSAYPDLHSKLRALWATFYQTGEVADDIEVYKQANESAANMIALAEKLGMLGELSHVDDYVGLMAMADELATVAEMVKARMGR
jgi:hypothetical protein